MSKTRSLLTVLALAAGLTGCDFAKFAAGSTIRVITRAAPAIQRYEDPDLAEAGMPASIATMEGLLVIKPEDQTLRETLARSYASLGYGFFDNHMEEAEANLDDEGTEYWRRRASLAYKRSKQIAFEMMAIWEPEGEGPDGHIRQGIDAWKAYLQRFDEDQVGTLFWASYSWVRYIGANRDDINAVADLAFAQALADRVYELDASYYNHAPHALRGGLLASLPAQYGGRPEEGKREIEIAIAATQRKNLLYLVMEARLIAVPLQDRALYRSLLEEVIEAPVDLDPDQRLSNQLAKLRATRYLAQIDELFEPEGATPDEGTSAGEAAAPSE